MVSQKGGLAEVKQLPCTFFKYCKHRQLGVCLSWGSNPSVLTRFNFSTATSTSVVLLGQNHFSSGNFNIKTFSSTFQVIVVYALVCNCINIQYISIYINIHDCHTYFGGGWIKNIICALGGAHSRFPLRRVCQKLQQSTHIFKVQRRLHIRYITLNNASIISFGFHNIGGKFEYLPVSHPNKYCLNQTLLNLSSRPTVYKWRY